MGLNRKLTRVVKDRVIQNFQMTGSELLSPRSLRVY